MKPFDYPFEAGGTKYVLRYNFGVRRQFERKNKKSVPGMLNRLSNPDTQTADELIDLFLMLLSSAHPSITADDVGGIIDAVGGEDIAMRYITEALAEQSPGQAGAPHPQ